MKRIHISLIIYRTTLRAQPAKVVLYNRLSPLASSARPRPSHRLAARTVHPDRSWHNAAALTGAIPQGLGDEAMPFAAHGKVLTLAEDLQQAVARRTDSTQPSIEAAVAGLRWWSGRGPPTCPGVAHSEPPPPASGGAAAAGREADLPSSNWLLLCGGARASGGLAATGPTSDTAVHATVANFAPCRAPCVRAPPSGGLVSSQTSAAASAGERGARLARFECRGHRPWPRRALRSVNRHRAKGIQSTTKGTRFATIHLEHGRLSATFGTGIE